MISTVMLASLATFFGYVTFEAICCAFLVTPATTLFMFAGLLMATAAASPYVFFAGSPPQVLIATHIAALGLLMMATIASELGSTFDRVAVLSSMMLHTTVGMGIAGVATAVVRGEQRRQDVIVDIAAMAATEATAATWSRLQKTPVQVADAV